MSDEHLENELDLSDEYEEICSDEVDRVVETLDQLAESVSSENIRTMLEETSQNIYGLIYEEEDDIEADDSSDDLIATDESPTEEEDELPCDEDDDLTAEAA